MQHDLEELQYWVAFSYIHWIINSDKIRRGLRELGYLGALWHAPDNYLHELGLTESNIRSFKKFKQDAKLDSFKEQIMSALEMNVNTIKFTDVEYPVTFRTHEERYEGFPIILFHKGILSEFNKCLAIVGSRMCSFYAHTMSRQLARELADMGYTIVSGLARGVDTEAHCGALESNSGKTIAVLAWMHPIYPPENEELAKDIETRGALMSEYFKKFETGGQLKFVQRNRITSGIARYLIAVETDEEGGTVHQVRYALSQGVKAFVVEPRDNKRAMRGYKVLKGMGAIPIRSVDDVVNYMKHTKNVTLESKLDKF